MGTLAGTLEYILRIEQANLSDHFHQPYEKAKSAKFLKFSLGLKKSFNFLFAFQIGIIAH